MSYEYSLYAGPVIKASQKSDDKKAFYKTFDLMMEDCQRLDSLRLLQRHGNPDYIMMAPGQDILGRKMSWPISIDPAVCLGNRYLQSEIEVFAKMFAKEIEVAKIFFEDVQVVWMCVVDYI